MTMTGGCLTAGMRRSRGGIAGRLLHALIGYTDRPTELQLIAYIGTLALMAVLSWIAAPRPVAAAPAAHRVSKRA